MDHNQNHSSPMPKATIQDTTKTMTRLFSGSVSGKTLGHTLRSLLPVTALLVLPLTTSVWAAPETVAEPAVTTQQTNPPRQPHTKPVTIALGAEPEAGFDPIYGWGHYNNPLMQSALLKRDGSLDVVGDLAQSWTLSNDGRTWQVSLKPHLKFSDGSNVTAQDVAFTYRTAKSAASLYDLTNLDRVEVSSSDSLTFHLKQPDIAFMDTLASLAIVPQHAYGPEYAQHPVGSGPYQFVRWQKGQLLELIANPYYYGKKPDIRHLIIVFSEEDSRFSQLLAHQLDLAAIPPHYVRSLPSNTKLWSVKSVDNRGIAWPMVAYDGKAIGNDVTSDKAIRTAIDDVIDRDVLVQGLLEGHARPAYSIADSLPWNSAPTKIVHASLDEAKQLLDNAGWRLHDGVREKNGVKAQFTLYYKSGDSIREQLTLTVAQMIKPLGIIVDTKGTSWENISKVMHREPVLFGFGALSPSEMRYTYHSDYRGVDFYNSGYYQNRQVDMLLDKAQSAASWSQSMPYYRQAQTLIYTDEPWTWLVNLQHLYAGNPCLDLATPMVEPHDHGWPLTNNIVDWTWVCPDPS
ncbi:ABC transporter substrate-binding protein [Photobacterium nomapromontoriensis]|uniref:ABC transporter substrate-binding protein n=1 Tax=Photobacterium nomapromontoriensis TaxID=2910237 RepID=UPI003D0D0660